MKRLTINTIPLLAASFFALAASANASDLGIDGRADQYEPAPVQADVNWTGLWLGAAGGYAFSNTEGTYTDDRFKDDVFVNNKETINIDGLGTEGFFGEAQLGYDQRVSSNLIVGIFGGYNLSDSEFTTDISSNGTSVLSVSTDYDWGAVAGLRLGFLKSESTMFYLAGGYAHAQLGDTLVNGVKFNTGGDELDGWFGEIGMETQITGNVFLTVSGRYTDYGSETLWSNDYNHGDHGNHDTHVEAIEIDTDSLAVMVGIKAKLGGF